MMAAVLNFAGQFFEGGINITQLLPGSDSCFSAFMATSRSSAEPNASIKNFVISSSRYAVSM